MKRLVYRAGAFVIALMTALVFIGCDNGGGSGRSGDNMFVPGPFTATVPGFTPWPAYAVHPRGSITVRVEFSENRIESVTVTESTEQEPFRSATMTRIPAAIVEHQSTNIDVVAGATITSMAIITAVENAIMEAWDGGDLSSLDIRPQIPAGPARTINDYDVVVVGSGVAGLAAAIEAAGVSGTNVLVIEKLGFFGGVTATSGGMIHGADTPAMRARTNDPNNIFQGDSAAAFRQELIDLSLGLHEAHDKVEILTRIADSSTNTIAWLQGMGINWTPGDDPMGLAMFQSPTRAWRGSPFARALTPVGFGRAMMQSMITHAENNGITFMSDTKAVSLIMSGGNVRGVNATDITGAAVTINANSVVLATGGFHNCDDLMAAHHPLIMQAGAGGHVNRWHLPGAYGQGLTMARRDAQAGFINSPTPIAGVTNAPAWGIWVTPEGNRFFDESWQYGLAAAGALGIAGENGFGYHWTIMRYPNIAPGLTANNTTIFSAATLDTLLEAMPVSAGFGAALRTTITAYNAAVESGNLEANLDFWSSLGVNNVPVANQNPRTRHLPISLADRASDEPATVFWAQRSGLFGDIWGTNSGLSINPDGQVLTSAGAPIGGLFAAGEVVGWILPVQYGGSGMAITIWTNQARYAGRAAAR